MVKKPTSAPNKSLNSQSKDNIYKTSTTQLQTIFEYLSSRIETATMVSFATGIPQKSICRYKRDLEKKGLLSEIEKKLCRITKFKAWYITTNPKLIPIDKQTKLF
jgi:hypothetical protein